MIMETFSPNATRSDGDDVTFNYSALFAVITVIGGGASQPPPEPPRQLNRDNARNREIKSFYRDILRLTKLHRVSNFIRYSENNVPCLIDGSSVLRGKNV